MKIILIFFAIIILPISVALATDNLTFGKAIEIALQNNYSIKISKVNQNIAANNNTAGNAGMLPKLDVTAGAAYSNTNLDMKLLTGQSITQSGNVQYTYNAGAQLNFTLFDGMAMFVSYDKLHEIKNKSDIELRVTIENSILSIAQAYVQALKLQNNLAILKKNIQISKERLERLEVKKEFGNAIQLEILRAQVDKNNDSVNYLRTELSYRSALKNINFLMGNNIEQNFVLDNKIDSGELKNLNELRQLASTSNSTIMRALKNIEISQLDKKLILSTYLPRLNLSAGYTYSRQEAEAGFMLFNQSQGLSANLNLSWNLFNGFQNATQEQNAELAIALNNISTEQIKSQIDLALINSYDTYQRRLEILNFEQQNIKTVELNFQRTQELYNLGQASSIDLRQAQNNLSASETRIIEAELDAIQSKIEINLLTGAKIF